MERRKSLYLWILYLHVSYLQTNIPAELLYLLHVRENECFCQNKYLRSIQFLRFVKFKAVENFYFSNNWFLVMLWTKNFGQVYEMHTTQVTKCYYRLTSLIKEFDCGTSKVTFYFWILTTPGGRRSIKKVY